MYVDLKPTHHIDTNNNSSNFFGNNLINYIIYVFILILLIKIFNLGGIIISNVNITQKGPEGATWGVNFTVHVKVQNPLDEKITNVKAVSQHFNYDFGEISANRNVLTSYEISMPTIEQLKEDFGKDVKLCRVFNSGKITLTYVYKGEEFTVESNELNISIC